MAFGILLQKLENKLIKSDKTSEMIKELEKENGDTVEKFSMLKEQEDEILKLISSTFKSEERELLKKNGLNTSLELITTIKQIDLPVSELTESGKVLRLGLLNVVKETLEYQKDSIFKMLESRYSDKDLKTINNQQKQSIDIENSKSAFKMFQNIVNLMILEITKDENVKCKETDLTGYYVGIGILLFCLMILLFLYLK